MMGVVAGAVSAVDPWRFDPHPEVIAILFPFAALYWLALHRLAPRLLPAGHPPATRRQVRLWWAGFAVLFVGAEWPIHDISERYLYSVHMVQHIAFSLVAPPLLLLGMPGWLTRWLLRPRSLSTFVRGVTRPLVAGVIFNAAVAITHIPSVVDFTLDHDTVHFFAHVFIFVTSLIMWFPVINRLPEYPRLSYPGRMIYLFLQSILPTVPASFLTFAEGPVYRFYARVPRPFAISLISDQQVAGAIMKVGESTLLWGIIVIMFFRWYREEEPTRRGGGEMLTWAAVERQLEAAVGSLPAEHGGRGRGGGEGPHDEHDPGPGGHGASGAERGVERIRQRS